MEDRIRDAITSALEKAGMDFDTDGTNIWIDDPETNRTFFVSVGECEK